jgi:MoaA/NifB/PqqE/SkfB family radical SAM enzyme
MRARDRLAYGRTFLQNALGGSSPRVLYVEVTKRCNAFCGFCPYWQDHRRNELTDYSPIVEKMRPFCVTFTGGEPLLRRDMPELIRQVTALSPRPYTALLTNGWLLSPDKALVLRDAGLEQVSISLDYVGVEHDAHRGLPGVFDKLERRMGALRAVGFDRIVVNTVIMESNLQHLEPLALRTARWGVLHSFSCYSALKTDSDGQLVPSPRLRELEHAVAGLRRLKRRLRHIITSDFYFDGVVEYFRNGGRLGDRCRAAGRRFYHIDPWGHVKICPEFEPFAHWTELDEKRPPAHDCTRCWYGCRGENEAPLTLGRLRDLRIG